MADDIPEPLISIPEGEDKPAETRLANGASARAIVRRAVENDTEDAKRRAYVDRLVAGFPPYSDARRKAMNLTWTANVNFMGGKALMDSSSVPYYQIFKGVQCYVEVRSNHQKDHPDYEVRNGRIGTHFHNLCSRWKQFDFNIQNASYHMRKHGIGACFFERQNDWRFRSITSGMVLVPQGSVSCIDKQLPWIAVRVRYTVCELWNFIRNTESAAALGFDVEAVKLAIKRAGQGLLGDNRDDWYNASWETYERRLTNDDVAFSEESDKVSCAHLLVQEFNGKVSHVIVTESEVLPDDQRAQNAKDSSFLFKHPQRYDDFDEALVVFFQNIGDGTWHSVRGLADDAAKLLEGENRLMCRGMDGAFIGSSLVVQPGSTANKDKLQLAQWGPVTILPAGATLPQTGLQGALDGPLVMLRVIKNQMAGNIGQFQPRSLSREDGKGEVPTKAQVDAEVTHGSTLNDGQMTLFYSYLDNLFEQMFKRAADPSTTDEEAKRFQRECAADGIPAKSLQDMEFVRANRASGYGSPQMRQMTDRQMIEMGLVPMLPEQGKQNFLDDAIGGIKGAEKVERYNPRERLPDRNDADAAMENSMIKNGDTPVMISGQNNVIHMQSHLEHAANTLLPLREAMAAGQVDEAMLQQGYQYVQIMGAHCEQHIALMANDQTRKGLADLFEDKLRNLVSFSGKLYQAIQQVRRQQEIAAEEQAQATALGALDEAKRDSIYADIENRKLKTAADVTAKTTKTVSNIRLQNIEAAAKLATQLRTSKSQQKAA